MDPATQLVRDQLRVENFIRRDPSRFSTPPSRTGVYVRRDPNTGYAVVRLPNGSTVQGQCLLDANALKPGDPVMVNFSPGSAVPFCSAVRQSNQWERRDP